MSAAPRMSSPRIAWPLALTGAALFMVVLDNLIVLSALPAIQDALRASDSEVQWVVDAYVLALAVLLLTGAALGDRLGRRRVFVAGVLVFAGASAGAALAPGIGGLVAARVLQGVGAAAILPLSLTLLIDAVPPARRGVAVGVWSSISGLGVALGPALGGLLTEAWGWEWIFWVNVPVGLAVAVLAPLHLTETRPGEARLDLPGTALAAGGLLALTAAPIRATEIGWTAPATAVSAALGVTLLTALVLRLRGADAPVIPLHVVTRSRAASAHAVGFLLHFAMFGMFFLVVQLLAGAHGDGPVDIALHTLPWTLMPVVVAPLSGRLGTIVPPRVLAVAGLTLITVGGTLLAVLAEPSTGPAQLAPALALIGIGIGLVLPSLVTLLVDAVPAEDVGRASGALATFRQLGAVFGVAVAPAVAAVDGTRAGLAVAAGAAGLGVLAAAAPGVRHAAGAIPALAGR